MQCIFRLGKLACTCVNDDQNIDEDDQKIDEDDQKIDEDDHNLN